jgi:AraC-like DNA-binding protein
LIFVYQSFLGEPLAPKAIHFVHDLERPEDKARYQEVLGCPVEFNRNRCQIVLARSQLARPIHTADDRLLHILKSHCEMVLNQHNPPSTSLTARIEREIVEHLTDGKARAETIAGRLGMAERTMHRRLAEEGTSFTALHESLRRELAHKYIRDATIPLQEIAYLLGYASQSAFSVAFKRWTGKTPSQMRTAGAF